jgi:DNA-directed RNA polymerase specialized sigma24 family protein
MSSEPNGRWRLNREAFDRLLRRLDEAPEAAGREYEAIRRKLVYFFEIRGAVPSEALADTTIDRVAQKLDAGEPIGHLRAYFYGVAKRVLLEWEKTRAREHAAMATLPQLTETETAEAREAQVSCLERCLGRLPDGSRELIVSYYQCGPTEVRKGLAHRLGISYSSLKTRAHRIRCHLEACLRRCLESTRISVTNEHPGSP